MEEIKTYDPYQFKIASLLDWLGLRNSFNEAKRLSKSDFASLIKDVVNNLDNNDYQTKINNDNCDLKNAE